MTVYKHLAHTGILFAVFALAMPALAASACYTNASYDDAGKTCSDIELGALNGTPYISGTPGMQFGPTAVSGTVGGTGNTASAAASAGFGALHVSGYSHYDAGPSFNTAHGNAYASFTDQLTGGLGGAVIDVTAILEGSLTLSATAHSMVHLYDETNGFDLLDFSGFMNVNSSTQTSTSTISLVAGRNYLLYSAVEVEVDTVSENTAHLSRTAIGDLSNTSKLTLDVQSGSFTSFSGSNYSASAAESTVPEPASWAMLILGMGATGTALRRKRRPVLA